MNEVDGFDKIQKMLSDEGYQIHKHYQVNYNDNGVYSIIFCKHKKNYHTFDIKHMYDVIGVDNIITWKMEIEHLQKAIVFTLILDVTVGE